MRNSWNLLYKPMAPLVMVFAITLAANYASAAIIDLTYAGAVGTGTGTIGGDFRVEQSDPHPTGTGVIDPFVRIQHKGNEGGYNTDAIPQLDSKAGTWTHSLLLSSVPIVNIGGVDYRQFLLDIYEDKGQNDEFLSLNQIQFFLGNAPDLTHSALDDTPANAAPVISFGAGTTEVFRLNNNTNPFTEIKLNAALNPGNGGGDMFLYVRDDAFTGPNQYVYMYSQFGAPPGADGSSSSFEEWAVLEGGTGSTAVPEPSSVILGLIAAGGMGGLLRWRRRFLGRK